jgi:DNA-binding PadR family transcriptional regulator
MANTPGDHTAAVVLAALEGGAAHGYRIAQRIVQWSEGELRVGEGSLYPMLHALEAQGWIESHVEQQGDRTRRVYQLTSQGTEALEAERRQWQHQVVTINRVIMGEGRLDHV